MSFTFASLKGGGFVTAKIILFLSCCMNIMYFYCNKCVREYTNETSALQKDGVYVA